MSVEVLEPGLATTIQDLGRPGGYNVGIPPSGALDQRSARLANLIVGNSEQAALLEAPYLAPRLRAIDAGLIAVTGATVELRINGDAAPTWTAVPVEAGDEISFGYVNGGARVYIAFAGGIDVPVVMGSRSTYALGSLGGIDGRPLRVGDILTLGRASRTRAGIGLPDALRPEWPREAELRVVLGLYDYRLTEEAREVLLSSTWTLTPVADRTGFRYQGPRLAFTDRVQPFGAGSDPSNIVDAGYPIGSIQVPSGSEPIILHRDAVSGGGYAMVGTVISVDLDRVGQCAPGTATSFVPVTMEEALTARRDARQELEMLRASIS